MKIFLTDISSRQSYSFVFLEKEADSFSPHQNILSKDSPSKIVEQEIRQKLHNWWRGDTSQIKEISKDELEVLKRGGSIEVSVGEFVTLEKNIHNEFDIIQKNKEKSNCVFLRERNPGVYHVFNRDFPEKYLILDLVNEQFEDANGQALEGTIEANIESHLGIPKSDIRIQFIKLQLKEGYDSYMVCITPQSDMVDVRKSNSPSVSRLTEFIQQKNDFNRGKKILLRPGQEFPLDFSNEEETVLFELSHGKFMQLTKKIFQNNHLFVFLDPNIKDRLILMGLVYDEKKKKDMPFYIYQYIDERTKEVKKQYVPAKFQLYGTHSLVRFPQVGMNTKINFEFDSDDNIRISNDGDNQFGLLKQKITS